jgi:hypothetical protein
MLSDRNKKCSSVDYGPSRATMHMQQYRKLGQEVMTSENVSFATIIGTQKTALELTILRPET